MSIEGNGDSQIGIVLAERLGVTINKREGHDLAGPCIACKSSDAFRLHQLTGVAQCYSCGGKWSPFQVAEHVLRNRDQAKSVRIAVLPAEYKESSGTDVRDVLVKSDGVQLVRQAIKDAQSADHSQKPESGPPIIEVFAEIELSAGDPVNLIVSPAGKKPQRLVIASRSEVFHRDRINTDSSISRDRFTKKLAAKLGLEVETLALLIDPQLTELADRADEQAAGSAGSDGGGQESQATIAANMAAEWDLWHTPGGDAVRSA